MDSRTGTACAERPDGGIMAVMLSSAALARLLLTVLLTALPQVGCGGEEPTASGERPVVVEPENPSVASSVADPSAPRIVSIVATGDTLSGDTGTVDLRRNVPVRLTVITDAADTVLVRGYDLRAVAVADAPVQLDFLADRPGEFEVVLEESGTVLTTLQVG